jgi:hypothetical protein
MYWSSRLATMAARLNSFHTYRAKQRAREKRGLINMQKLRNTQGGGRRARVVQGLLLNIRKGGGQKDQIWLT